MFDLIELLTFFGCIVAPIICIILYEVFSNWLEAKEIDQLNLFDYKIAAAEIGITYEEASFSHIFPFKHVVLEPRKLRKNRHCLTYSTEEAQIKFFDESYETAKLNLQEYGLNLKK